jgi:hypothetical protein
MYMPAYNIMYPSYVDISEHWLGYGLYAGLADTSIFRPDPILVNQHKVNPSPHVFLVS